MAHEYKLKTTLFPFQRDTVERAKAFNGRCMLALDMGTGKSICAITYLIETKSFPAIIICPASLKYNWAQEFYKHYDKTAVILEGRDPQKTGTITRSGDKVFILNYDIVPYWLPVLKAMKPEIVVLDEGHYTKNRSTKRTKACAELAYQANKFLVLTGTPMTKGDPSELWTCLMLFQGKIVSQYAFMNRYCRWHKTKYGVKVTGPKNLPELNAFLTNRCMIRYTIDEVLPDLPPFIR